MAYALPYIAAGVSVVGAVVQSEADMAAARSASREAFAQAMNAQAAAAVSAKNADIMEADAIARTQKAQEDAEKKRKEVQRLVATARAQEGRGGFSFAGTPEWLEFSSLSEGEKDAMAILNEGLTEASRMRSKGDIFKMESESYIKQSQSYLSRSSELISQGKKARTGTLLKGVAGAAGAF
uniref:Internal virion protein n=1 Tax=viral metagenome TaxID=1070528 RepID=A0A6M3IUJ9_9ZZZZ